MKKLITSTLTIALALALMLALAACGGNSGTSGSTPPPANNSPDDTYNPPPDDYVPDAQPPQDNGGSDPTPEETGGAVLGIVYPDAVDGSYVFGWGEREIPIGDRIPDILKGLPESMDWVFEFEGYYIEQCWVRSPDYAIVIRLSLSSGSMEDYDNLVAYYGEDAVETNQLTDSDGVEFRYDWGFLRLENQGHSVYVEITGDYGASWDLPINGTPLDVPPPFETHPADSTYYYQKEDDFALWILDMNYTAYAEDYGDNIQYNLLFNGKTEYGYDYGIQRKWVFESDDAAMKFMTDQGLGGSYVVSGNVVYSTITSGHGNFEETLAVGQNQVDGNGGVMYRSMP